MRVVVCPQKHNPHDSDMSQTSDFGNCWVSSYKYSHDLQCVLQEQTQMTRKWTINGPLLLSKLLKKNLHYVFPSTFSLRRSPDSPFSCPFGQDTTIRKVFPHLSASTQCRLSATTTCRPLLPLEHSFLLESTILSFLCLPHIVFTDVFLQEKGRV